MQSRELKCFTKLITVCKNRGMNNLADDILKILGPKYLEKLELKELNFEIPKSAFFADKISFLASVKYAQNCASCDEPIQLADAAFLKGKNLYHVLCGIENLGDDAKENKFYKRWTAQTIKINETQIQ